MEKTLHQVSYRVYWLTWILLLGITLFMIAIGYSAIPRLPKVLLLLMTMFTKGSLIAAYFMHLRFEKLQLIYTVALGILVTAAILWTFITFDGMRILQLSLR
ncbi:MAG: cytochrome C oxidase subunit IV family protein [Acidobacteria bacterium]|nr:cytochrome C oxidase subunit IV family protein [Acidobacteriota bacterium]